MTEFAALDIRIEVLQVEGLGHEDAPDFRRDVERELTRLVRESGLPAGVPLPRALVTVTADLNLRSRGGGQSPLAAAVAAAVYRALGQ